MHLQYTGWLLSQDLHVIRSRVFNVIFDWNVLFAPVAQELKRPGTLAFEDITAIK